MRRVKNENNTTQFVGTCEFCEDESDAYYEMSMAIAWQNNHVCVEEHLADY